MLGFEALCALSVVSQREVFHAAYELRKTSQDARFFVPQSGCEKIINMVDSDHGMRNTVIRMTGPLEAESKGERGAISITWNLGAVARGETLSSADIEVKLQKLAAINYNHRNWSGLLDPNRSPVPPVSQEYRLRLRANRLLTPRGRRFRDEWSLLRGRGLQYNPRNLNFSKR